MKRLAILATVVALLARAPPGALTAVGDRWGGALTPRQVVPSQDSRARGGLVIRQVRRSTLRYSLETERVSSTGTFAGIYVAGRGANGPRIFTLRDRPFGRRISGTLIPRDLQARGGIDDFRDVIRALNRGRLYVQVFTEDHRNGEIRGQIRKLRR